MNCVSRDNVCDARLFCWFIRVNLRVYHFVNRDYGLEDIERRRLKIATLDELNDPFEFFGVSLHDEGLRHAFRAMKKQLSAKRGLLCFSGRWSNPVQWSHYADKHRGLCLGFDVSDDSLGPVNYARRRMVVKAEQLRDPRQLDAALALKFLFTKYSHWRYENEFRCLVELDEPDSDKGLYFADFSDQMRLRQVIVGAEASVSRQQLRNVLGDLAPSVEAFKARLAYRSFRVVRQKNERLWV